MKRLILTILIIWAGFQQIWAADIEFYLEDEPIYTSNNPESPGFLNQIQWLLSDDL